MLAWAGCETTGEQNSEGKQKPVGEVVVENVELPAQFTRFYQGKIGKTLNVSMRLEREGETLRGIYWYDDKGIAIPIEGTVSEKEIAITEYGEPNKKTGEFDGKFYPDGHLEGNWNNPEKKLQFRFELTQVSESAISLPTDEAPTEGERITFSEKTDNDGEFSASYPNYAAAGFSKIHMWYRKWVKEQFEEFEKNMQDWESVDDMESTEEMSASTHYMDKELLSVYAGGSSYFSGAAHPNHNSSTQLWNLVNQTQIPVNELFEPNASWEKKLSKWVIEDIKQQFGKDWELDDASVKEGAGPDAKNFQRFLVSDKGLEILFDPYEVGPYAMGSVSVTLPWKKLKGIVNTEGPVGKFVE